MASTSAFLEALGKNNNVTLPGVAMIIGKDGGVKAAAAKKPGIAGKAKAGKAAKVKVKKPVDEKKAKVLERNRAAATRCREKKKQQLSDFDAKATQLKTSIGQKQTEIAYRRDEIAQLKAMLAQRHARGGGQQLGGGLPSMVPSTQALQHSSNGGAGPAVAMGAFGMQQQAPQHQQHQQQAFLQSGGSALVQGGGVIGVIGQEDSLNPLSLEAGDDGLMDMLLRDITAGSDDLLGSL